MPKETVYGDGHREADQGAENTGCCDGSDIDSAGGKEKKGVRYKEERDFGAENDTGCCYKRKEYLVLSRGEVGPWTRTVKETPEGARHCRGLAPQIEGREGAGHPIPSPKAKKFGNVRDA